MKDYLDKIHASLADHLGTEIEVKASVIAKYCESPIEVALGLALYMYARLLDVNEHMIFCQEKEMNDYGPDARILVPQFHFENKRIDFLLRDPPVQVFIECDGHDFHERTKQQAARDRKRDRQLQQSGTPILRFTGSEIYADPIGCAIEVFDIIGDLHMHDYFKRTD